MTTGQQRWLWGIIVCASAAALLLRIGALSPLYLDRGVRDSLRAALTRVSDERGWLLSDIQLDRLTTTTARLTYRPHLLGRDPQRCFVLELATSSLTPCPAE